MNLATATILVVDDEIMLREMAARMLREEGYCVTEAGCPEAMDEVRACNGDVDLTILDVVMPDCEGITLARDIRQHWPNQRILFTSGCPAEVLTQHGPDTSDTAFLAKPYTREALLAKVQDALRHPVKPANWRSS